MEGQNQPVKTIIDLLLTDSKRQLRLGKEGNNLPISKNQLSFESQTCGVNAAYIC